MATGTPADVVSRLQFLLPSRWFTVGMTAIRDAALQGLASALSFIYSLLAYIRQQTRIGTATDGFLDLIAADYFGTNLQRQSGESDPAYRLRILQALFRERNTRQAVVLILQELTGRTPIIFEPQRAADTGGYGGYLLAYGESGAYGSMVLPMQAFVTAFMPVGTGIPNVAGYCVPTGAYSTGSQAEYTSASMLDETVTDADVYNAVESVRPTCATLWVNIQA
jgi:hypothetical protein